LSLIAHKVIVGAALDRTAAARTLGEQPWGAQLERSAAEQAVV
jgi:hypothetical protein